MPAPSKLPCAHAAHALVRQDHRAPAPVTPIDGQHVELADIKSQYHAKRALEMDGLAAKGEEPR